MPSKTASSDPIKKIVEQAERLAKENPERACGLLRKALQTTPTHEQAPLLGTLAEIYRGQGNYSPARASFERAIQISPDDEDLLKDYTKFIYDELGDREAVERFLSGPNPTLRGSFFVWRRAINLSAGLGRYQEGYEVCAAAHRRWPRDGDFLLRMVLCKLALGELPAGARLARQALKVSEREEDPDCILEALFYLYIVSPGAQRPRYLAHIAKHLATDGILFEGEWILVALTNKAALRQHSEWKWLRRLGLVIAGHAPRRTLNPWPAFYAARTPAYRKQFPVLLQEFAIWLEDEMEPRDDDAWPLDLADRESGEAKFFDATDQSRWEQGSRLFAMTAAGSEIALVDRDRLPTAVVYLGHDGQIKTLAKSPEDFLHKLARARTGVELDSVPASCRRALAAWLKEKAPTIPTAPAFDVAAFLKSRKRASR